MIRSYWEVKKRGELDMENIKYHEVERYENLMYKGCESHWHCIHCDNYWPFHCYGKKDLEQMECPARNEKKVKDRR